MFAESIWIVRLGGRRKGSCLLHNGHVDDSVERFLHCMGSISRRDLFLAPPNVPYNVSFDQRRHVDQIDHRSHVSPPQFSRTTY